VSEFKAYRSSNASEAAVVLSGAEIRTPQGFSAIKDGIKSSPDAATFAVGGKPRWLRAPLATGPDSNPYGASSKDHRLATVARGKCRISAMLECRHPRPSC